MDIKPIKTRKDYERALKAVERLIGARRNTPEGDQLDVLVTLIEAYEARHFPARFPGLESRHFAIEQRVSVASLSPGRCGLVSPPPWP